MAKVVVLGASSKPERYSFQAISRLITAGHEVIPVNPRGGVIQGLQVVPNLDGVPEGIDTITLYISSEHVIRVLSEIQRIRPRRVIFNPGTEYLEGEELLTGSGIEVIKGCTLVMLATGTF